MAKRISATTASFMSHNSFVQTLHLKMLIY